MALFILDWRARLLYDLAMILRILRLVNRVFPYVVLFGYMGAFLLAFICIFSFPFGALVLVIGSVLSLAFVVFFGETLRGMEGMLTRRALKKNYCPACSMGPIQKNIATFQCLGCGVHFQFDGTQLSQDAQEIESSEMSEKLIVLD